MGKLQRHGASLVTLLLAAGCGEEAQPVLHPSDWVRPLIGSGGLGFGVGSIPPGPSLPFGLAKPGPDTGTNGGLAPDFSHCAGYWFEDDEVRAFSQLHLAGTGVPDYGVIGMMPALALPPGAGDPSAWRGKLVHALEQASVGYYRLDLVPSRVVVEVSATLRTALYRLSYPAGGSADLVFDLDHGLGGETVGGELLPRPEAGELAGWLLHRGALSGGTGYRVDFLARFDQPFTARHERGGRVVVLSFPPGSTVRLQLGLSFHDAAQAAANLEEEWLGFDLERAVTLARAAWDQALARVEISGGSERDRQIFYSALYRAELMPTHFTEGGRYRGLDGQLHPADGFTYYTDFSLWDTFRTLHPLLTLIAPERQRDFLRSLAAMTKDSGQLPKWPLATVETNTMIGYHGETVLADSYLRGLTEFPAEEMWQHARRAALEGTSPGRRRDCMDSYTSLGYCAADRDGRSVSKTLENAFADFVLGRFALALGHTEDGARLLERAESYRHVIDPDTGLARPREAGGRFVPEFSAENFAEDYTEGNARQWTPFVPHDVEGLAAAVGGSARLAGFLEELFTRAAEAEDSPLPDLWYWHGNEPDIHAAYMFAELGRPDDTARWVRWVREARYDDTPAGLDGNDDGGTLSAWYVWSALGLYPKLGEGRYVLGVPLFPEARLTLEGGTLLIRAEGLAPAARVREVRWNGVALSGPFLEHAELARGGELVFVLASE